MRSASVAGSRRRRLDGRDAGPRVGGDVPGAGGLGRGHRHDRRGHRPADRLSSIQRRTIALDPNWRGGDYYDAAPGEGPHQGLALARELAQITYRTDEVFAERFGRKQVDPLDDRFTLWQRFEVERYLDYHGRQAGPALRRQLLPGHQQGHGPPRPRSRTRWARRGPRPHPRAAAHDAHHLRHALSALPAGDAARSRPLAGASPGVHHVIDSPHGHDAFLLETEQVGDALAPFLADLEKQLTMTDTDDAPCRRPVAIRAGRGDNDTALAPILWATTTFVTPTVDEGRRMATRCRLGALLQPLRQPHRGRLRGRHRRARGGRDRPGLRVGHGRDQRRRPGPVLVGRSHRRPAPALRRHAAAVADGVPPVRHRRHVRRRHRAGRLRRGRPPRRRPRSSSPRRRPTHASTWSTSTSSARSPARSPSSTPPSPPRSASGRWTTASTWSCTRPRRPSPATTTPPSAWWPAARSSSTGSGASPCSRGPTPRRSTP